MSSNAHVYQVARLVANGDGDWGEVPRCVREAIVLSLQNGAAVQVQREAERPRELPPPLSESVLQRSVQTFEDAAWMRDQGVRSYARFHNSVETLHGTVKEQQRALWRTAMQLHPGLLTDIRNELGLRRSDEIPDGIPISSDVVASIARQEDVLEELIKDLHRLRDHSVRFAAYFLTDEEKRAMGANPAYLRPTDVDREMHHTKAGGETPNTNPQKTAHHSPIHDAPPALAKISASASAEDPILAELRRQYMMRIAELSIVEDRAPQGTPITSRRSSPKQHQRASSDRRSSHAASSTLED